MYDCPTLARDPLPHVCPSDVPRDMDAVRAALGDEQLSFLGFSYGSMIGQVYADLFPENIRSMILDGIVELGPTGLEAAATQAEGPETALVRWVEHCASACVVSHDPLGAVEQSAA